MFIKVSPALDLEMSAVPAALIIQAHIPHMRKFTCQTSKQTAEGTVRSINPPSPASFRLLKGQADMATASEKQPFAPQLRRLNSQQFFFVFFDDSDRSRRGLFV